MMSIKQSVEDLAIFGGPPLLEQTLHVGGPNVGDRRAFFERLDQMLDRNWLTNDGPLVRELEARLADFLGVRHCIAICNGTVALEIAIRALELEGEVIVPSFTFIATAHALWWQGIRPVFCDIDPATHCLDPAEVERHVTPRTTGILGVHVWGQPCDVQGLEAVADRHGLQLLYDAAHAFAASHRGRMIGSFGRCEVLSFHATKFFNTLEGGAIVTNDDELADKTRLMRNFGFAGLDQVIYIGTNGKMCEAAAAMGLTNLESLQATVDRNRATYDAYRAELGTIGGLRMVQYDESERCNYQYIVCEIAPELGIARDDLMQILHMEQVRARRYFWPGCHRMEPYRSLFPQARSPLPVTDGVAERILVLPHGGALQSEHASRIGGFLRWLSERRHEVAERLEAARAAGELTEPRFSVFGAGRR